MKYYKDYPLIGFGMSDIASLVLVYFDNVDYEVQSKILPMGSDGSTKKVKGYAIIQPSNI